MSDQNDKKEPASANLPAQAGAMESKAKIKEKRTVVKKRFNGIVVSDKMDKTIVVKVDRVKAHPKYMKRYTVSKNYKVHDEKNEFKEDDKVTFTECRPLSKDKRWRVIYTKGTKNN